MASHQDFLVKEAGGMIGVFGVGRIPPGTVIGDGRKLQVEGPSPVPTPEVHMRPVDFDLWCKGLVDSGYRVEIRPIFGESRPPAAEVDRGETVPLRTAFDELLRRAEQRSQLDHPKLEPSQPGHP